MSAKGKCNGNTSAAPKESPQPERDTPASAEVPTPGLPAPSYYPPPVERTGLNGSSMTRHLTIDTPITECPTNLDPANPKHRALLFDAGNPADYKVGADNQCVVTATHWLVYPEEREDEETGEVRQFAVVVLFDREGKFFKTTSQFGPRKMKAAIELFKAPDWERGVTFIITVRIGQRKRPYHDIRVVMDEQIGVPGD